MSRSLYKDDGSLNWNDQMGKAAVALAKGFSNDEAGKEAGVDGSTVWRWTKLDEFAEEVDKLSCMYGLASRAERMRTINRAARQFVKEDGNLDISGFNLLDLIKEARMQTEGVRLGIFNELAAEPEKAGSVAVSRSGSVPELPESISEETD